MQIKFPRFPDRFQCQYIKDDGPWSLANPPKWCMHQTIPGSVYCWEHDRACHIGTKRQQWALSQLPPKWTPMG